jgi:hypothetical protein
MPDLYEGCCDPHGGPVSRERARNVRSLLYPKPNLPTGKIEQAQPSLTFVAVALSSVTSIRTKCMQYA